MGGDEPQVYLDGNSNTAYVGDPFTGVPVSRDIVESVATQYHINADSLARALRDIRGTSIVDVGALFTGFDPLPVGRSDDGLLYVLAEGNGCWDAAADQVGLTEDGRDAVATAHDRQARARAEETDAAGGQGFVVSCSEFPAAALEGIHSVVERTRLTNRQATVWVLTQHVPGSDAIARILSVPEALVRTEIASVDRVTRQSVAEAQTLDVPGPLSRLDPDPQSPTWMGLDWSRWFNLVERDTLLGELPRHPGLYRVRHTDLPGLMYVGESGAEGGVRERVGLGLSTAMNEQSQRTGDQHGAARPLRRIVNLVGGETEVSVATPPISAHQGHRRAIEATLVAVCRRETDWTPMVQLNREPTERVTAVSGEGNQELLDTAESASYTVPSWRPWRDVTDPSWLGLEWSEGRPLAERGEIDSTGIHAFRLWRPDQPRDIWGRTLELVGTTGSIASRLFHLENQYGDEVRFSVVRLGRLSADAQRRSRELSEARYDLVGAHYLATGHPPGSQS